jgi:hypothetical protein
MGKESILKALDEIFENKKARNFLNHLVRSYFPDDKVEKIFIKPKSKFKCVITNTKLVSVNDILNGVDDENTKNEFFEYLHQMFDTDLEVNESIKNLVNGRHMAVQGSKTNTYMSSQTYIVFYDWVLTKFITGDKHITWLLKGLNKEDFMERAESLTDDEVKKVLSKKKKKEGGNRATFTLGNLSALQELKNKMDK